MPLHSSNVFRIDRIKKIRTAPTKKKKKERKKKDQNRIKSLKIVLLRRKEVKKGDAGIIKINFPYFTVLPKV